LKNKIKAYPKWIEKQIEEKNLIKFEKINPDNPPLLKETVYVTKIYSLLIKKFRNDIKQAVEGLKKEIESRKIPIDRLIERKAIVSDTKEKFVSDFNQEIDDILKTINRWFE